MNTQTQASPGEISQQEFSKDVVNKVQEVEETHALEDDDKPFDPTDKTAHEYDHERFETFQIKVAQLVIHTFGAKLENVVVQKMRGGSFNQVIGVKITTPEPRIWTLDWLKDMFRCINKRSTLTKEAENYVVRIPRWAFPEAGYGLEYDVAVLNLARSRICAPIPEVTYFDPTDKNLLGKPYMIQKRLPGESLNKCLDSLNIAQSASLTRQILAIHRDMHTMTSAAPGIITPSGSTAGGVAPLETLQVPQRSNIHTGRDRIPPISTASAPQTTLEYLLDTCSRWEAYEKAINLDHFVQPIWSQLKKIAKHLHARNFIPDTDQFHFYHADIFPRNILVTKETEQSVKVTGLLDWDATYACYVPKFMAFRAPFWLWLTEDQSNDTEFDLEAEEYINTCPTTADSHIAAKSIWEQEAGEEWKRIATAPEYIIARRMWLLLRDGMFSNQSCDVADEVVQAWQELHPDDDVEEEFEFDLSDSEDEHEMDRYEHETDEEELER
jgi:hypothetical protein